MTQYVLNMWQPVGVVPPDDFLAEVMKKLGEINDEIRDAGGWVFSGGLHPPSAATVVSFRDGDAFTTDGPYAEGKEHIGGFWIVEAPDLDGALAWAEKIVRVTTLPIEVRPFQGRA